MAMKMLLATVTVAAVAVGLVLPAPHMGQTAFHHPHSQIAQLDIGR